MTYGTREEFILTRDLSFDDFNKMSEDWESAESCFLFSEEGMTEESIVAIVGYAFKLHATSFSNAVLGEIAELDQTPAYILKEILKNGGKGAVESVCLRGDLDKQLLEICKTLDLDHDQSGRSEPPPV